MTFDNLVTKLIQDSTSKAPEGDSYDSQNNWKPSGVSSDSDGPGGRYRRTRQKLLTGVEVFKMKRILIQ